MENRDDIPYLAENYEWRVVPEHEATWELYEDLQQRFPDFHLEDKVNLERESNDRPPILYQYTRRGKKDSGMARA